MCSNPSYHMLAAEHRIQEKANLLQKHTAGATDCFLYHHWLDYRELETWALLVLQI